MFVTIVISSDEIKKTLPNYIPQEAERFHHDSARLADLQFYQFLKSSDEVQVILMSGGAASGKTEYLSAHLTAPGSKKIILDTTLSSIEGAKIKLKAIYKRRKKAAIYFVYPDDLRRSYVAFLNRDRKFSEKHFHRTHVGARRTLLWVATEYKSVKITLIESMYTESQVMRFKTLIFKSRDELVRAIRKLQLTETDIITLLT